MESAASQYVALHNFGPKFAFYWDIFPSFIGFYRT